MKNIDEFIKNHSYINYCEAIIDKNGKINYATPSSLRIL